MRISFLLTVKKIMNKKTKTLKMFSKSFKNLSGKLIFHKGFIANAEPSSKGMRLNFSRVSCAKIKIWEPKTQKYPIAKQLSLPVSVTNVTSEKLKFTQFRNRDINGSFISTSTSVRLSKQKVEVATSSEGDSYNCSRAISLSSEMQTNVPQPFISKGKITHMIMPGSQWLQMDKSISSDLNQVHKTDKKNVNPKHCSTSNLNNFTMQKVTYFCSLDKYFTRFSSDSQFDVKTNYVKCFCTDKKRFGILNKTAENINRNAPSVKQKFKNTIKNYGIAAVAVYVSISIVSLGCCYWAVASGVSDSSVFQYWGVDEGSGSAGIAAVFVTAYAIHKAMALGRILITLTATPFLVKKLRKMGYLKSIHEKPS